MPARTTRLSTLAITTITTEAAQVLPIPSIPSIPPISQQTPAQALDKPTEPTTQNHIANHTVLTASIAEVEPLRYTPAGLPALNLRLEHASDILEAGQVRQVKLVVKAVAFGALAERLVKQPMGSVWRFNGFLATPRNGKSVVLHIQALSQD